MAGELRKEWCRVEEYKGALVLLWRGYNSDEDDYEMAAEINAEDYVEGATVGRVSARVAGQTEEACSDSNWEQFCGIGDHDNPLYQKLVDRAIEMAESMAKEDEE